MCHVKLLTFAHDGFAERINDIIELYNDSALFAAKPVFNSPERLFVLAPINTKGGVILNHFESFNKEGDLDISGFSIMFAAFDPEHRKKGLLKACLKKAEKFEMDIRYVSVGFDATEPYVEEVWRKLGFTHMGLIGLDTVLSKKREPFINHDALQNITFLKK
jgi:ribosomal protein S18 acetylase RimI-like enzyme